MENYRRAKYLNEHPEDLPQLFSEAGSMGSLEAFAKIYEMLKPEIRLKAIKLASHLIIKVAKQIADTGYRSGKMKLVKGISEATEIELDQSLENYVNQPALGMLDNLVSYVREKEKNAFVVMIDHSYSMRGMKMVLAAITAAAIAFHFKTDYAILAFSSGVTQLKGINEVVGPEKVLERLFALELRGDTNVNTALEQGLQQMHGFEKKRGLLLTDGEWNAGSHPQQSASRFDKLNVICFPPANPKKIKLLSQWGQGEFAFVENQAGIAAGIIKCLN